MKNLEDILRDNFDCKQPFYKEPKQHKDRDGVLYEHLTKSGAKAYGKLINILYDIANLVENKDFMNCIEDVIEELDSICNDGY